MKWVIFLGHAVYYIIYCMYLGLKLHIETTHNMGPGRPRKYPCDKCDKRFKCEADLTLHNVTHTKEKVILYFRSLKKKNRRFSITIKE